MPVLLDLKSDDKNPSKIYNNFLLSLVEQRKHKVYLFPFRCKDTVLVFLQMHQNNNNKNKTWEGKGLF